LKIDTFSIGQNLGEKGYDLDVEFLCQTGCFETGGGDGGSETTCQLGEGRLRGIKKKILTSVSSFGMIYDDEVVKWK
jgi:hypothetical protein